MKGKRIPVPPNGDIFAAVNDAGDYCGPVDAVISGNKMPDGSYEQIPIRRVAFILPVGRDLDVHGGGRSVHHVNEPPHKFTEEPNGTLTITASILSTWNFEGCSHSWHGYLTKGEWVTA